MTSVDMLTARLPMLALLPVACSPIVMVVLGTTIYEFPEARSRRGEKLVGPRAKHEDDDTLAT
jgi:hypothetical protein